MHDDGWLGPEGMVGERRERARIVDYHVRRISAMEDRATVVGNDSDLGER